MPLVSRAHQFIERSAPAGVTASVGLLLAVAFLSLQEAFRRAVGTSPSAAAGLVGLLSLAGAASTALLLRGRLTRLRKGMQSLRGSEELFRLLFENGIDA